MGPLAMGQGMALISCLHIFALSHALPGSACQLSRRHRPSQSVGKDGKKGPWERWKGESSGTQFRKQVTLYFFHAATQNVHLLVLLFLISFCVSSMIFGYFNGLVGSSGSYIPAPKHGKRRRFENDGDLRPPKLP